jgi:hypothetical protein
MLLNSLDLLHDLHAVLGLLVDAIGYLLDTLESARLLGDGLNVTPEKPVLGASLAEGINILLDGALVDKVEVQTTEATRLGEG